MTPLQCERHLIDVVEARASSLPDDEHHTVAAAVLDIDGGIHVGANVAHFTGGPCAELVAIGVAAAAGARRLMAVAAAGDRGRGVIPPCGRCRQVLRDLHPDILVAMPGESGVVMEQIRRLLPGEYRHPDEQGPRLVRFHRQYLEAIRAGEKTTTIRWEEEVLPGRATFVYEDHPDFAHDEAEVLSVEPIGFSDLDDEYIAVLRTHYPTMPDGAPLTKVSFRLITAD